MARLRQYTADMVVSNENTHEIVKSQVYKRIRQISKVLAHRSALGLPEVMESLWKNKVRLLESAPATPPQALCLGFALFFDELDRLDALIS